MKDTAGRPDAILLRQDNDHVARLIMNAPGTLNALSDAMLAALREQISDISQDRQIRAVVIAAAGRAFCAGHNLKEMTEARQADDGGRAKYKELFQTCTDVMLAIRDAPQPVVAEVQGVAAAAGCQLVAACDLAVASSEARFGVNGIDIGLFCSTPMVALSRNIHRKLAFEMLTTGRFLAADEALSAGLVNRVVPANELEASTRALADTIASKLSLAVRIGKPAFYRQLGMELEEAYAYTGDVIAENMLFRETEESIAAFLNKRPTESES